MKTSLLGFFGFFSICVLTACGGGGSGPSGTSTANQPATPANSVTNIYPNEITDTFPATINLKDFWTRFVSMPEYAGFSLYGDLTTNGVTSKISMIMDKRTVVQTNHIFNSIELRQSTSLLPLVSVMLWVDKGSNVQNTLFYYSLSEKYCVGGASRKVIPLPSTANVGQSGGFFSGDLVRMVNNVCGVDSIGQFAVSWSIRAFEASYPPVCTGTVCVNSKMPFFCFENSTTKADLSGTTSICFEIKNGNSVGSSTRWFERTNVSAVNLSGFK